MPIQVGPFAVENRILSYGDTQPPVKVMPENQNRNEEYRHDGDQHREILQLTSHNNGPFCIRHVVDDDPEKAASEESKEKGEREEPRKTELMFIIDCSDDAERQTNQTDHPQEQRQTRETVRFDIFSLRYWDDVRTLAHFFAASGLGSALTSSSSALCSAGTSASVAF